MAWEGSWARAAHRANGDQSQSTNLLEGIQQTNKGFQGKQSEKLKKMYNGGNGGGQGGFSGGMGGFGAGKGGVGAGAAF